MRYLVLIIQQTTTRLYQVMIQQQGGKDQA